MKSIFSIFLTGAMLLSVLTACGTKTNKNTGDDARTTPSPAVTDMAQPNGTNRPDDMTDDVDKAADDAGEAVGDVVGGAGDAAGDVIGGVGDAVDDMVDGVEDAARGDDSSKQDKTTGNTAAEK